MRLDDKNKTLLRGLCVYYIILSIVVLEGTLLVKKNHYKGVS